MTGASGRIGYEFLAHKPEGVTVEAIIEPDEQHPPDCEWTRIDITEGDKIMAAVLEKNPDVIVHLAAMTDVDGCERDPDRAFAINRDGTAIVARAGASIGAHIFYMSTDYVFDGRRGPYSEDDDPNPLSIYGQSKLAGEEEVGNVSDSSVILRISVPFGARRGNVAHNFVSRLIENFADGKSVPIVDDQYTTPAYMAELADVMWLLLEKRETGIVHYGTANRLSRLAMAHELCRVMGFDESLAVPAKTEDFNFAAARPMESGFITDRIHEIMGRPPIYYGSALYHMIEELETR